MKILDKIFRANLNAVLITVLIHLILIFIFLLTQLKPPPQNPEAVIMVDPEKLEEMEKYFEAKKKVEEKMEKLSEEENMSLEEIRNLARSEESKTEDGQEKESEPLKNLKEQYEDELRKEMYGDEYDDIKAELNKQLSRDSITGFSKGDKKGEKSGDENYYSGPSLVKVELNNKKLKHYYVDIPVFTCKGSGTVIVSINIDKYGNVSEVRVKETSINSDRECLIDAARNAAISSKFESSNTGTRGKITYQFVAQN